jgi:putative transposase
MAEPEFKIRNQNAPHFVTFAVVDWLNVFTRPEYKNIIVDSLKFCHDKKGLIIHCWVIMSNHVHFNVSAAEGFLLSNILRDFKKYTSTKLLFEIRKNPKDSRKTWMFKHFELAGEKNSRNRFYQFWRQDNHPVELDDEGKIFFTTRYIHNNPVVSGDVEYPEEYLYSSARDYKNRKGLLPITELIL